MSATGAESGDWLRQRHPATLAAVLAAIGDVDEFFADQLRRLEGVGIDVSRYPLGHIAFRSPRWDDYLRRRELLERVCTANVENMWSGRPISKILLCHPLPIGGNHRLSLVELIPPPHNPRYPLALEHCGFVLGNEFDAFAQKHRNVISGQQDQGPHNQPLYVAFDNGRMAKFHQHSLQDVVAMSGHLFDGIYHVDQYSPPP